MAKTIKKWNLSKKQWQMIGRKKASSLFKWAYVEKGKGLRALKQSENVGGSMGKGIRKEAFKMIKWSKILYANAQKKVSYGKNAGALKKYW